MAIKYYQDGHAGTDSGTEANPYASLATLAAGVSAGDTANCSGTAVGVTFTPKDGVEYKQWPGETAWKVNANGAVAYAMSINGAARTDIDVSDVECYGGTDDGILLSVIVAGTFVFNDVISRNNTDDGIYISSQSGGAITFTGGAAHTNTGNGLKLAAQSGGVVTVTMAIYSNVEDGVYWATQTGGVGSVNGCNIYDNDDTPEQEVIISSCNGGSQQVTNCRIHDGDKHGIYVFNSASADIEISWNRIWSIGDAANEYCIWVSGSTDVVIVCNTIDHCDYGPFYAGASPNGVVKNNCITDISRRPVAVIGAPAIVGYDGDNNCFHTHGASYYWNATNYATLALWRVGSGQDANSIDTDPLFVDVSNNDFMLQIGSPAYQGGVVVPGIATVDCLGYPNTTPPCIGAHQTLTPGTSSMQRHALKNSCLRTRARGRKIRRILR